MKTKKVAQKRSSVPYEEGLLERLKDPNYASGYLNSILEEGGDDVQEVLLVGLRHIAKAYGFADIAKKLGRGRNSLYKAFSEKGNPSLDAFLNFIRQSRLQIRFESSSRNGGMRTKSIPLAAKGR
ncbi:MAG: hypothetical protein HY537_04150 [Deltaproteobacteria bacterium]|nr:hypothetical protein [Deltaproteobacteria bacterium]